MSSIPMMSIICVFLLSLSLPYSCYSFPSGLSLELIPPHSPKSPLFIPNVTFEERMQMLIQQSHARVHYLSDMISSSTLHPNGSNYSLQQDTTPVPAIKRIFTSTMVVEVGIGTFNNNAYKSYLLGMDTGGETIWTQCEGCLVKPNGHCYPQKEDYFPNTKSITYIPYNPPKPYSVEYLGGTNTSGFLAKETFTFPSTTSSSSSPFKLPNIVFGCGINNHNSLAKDTTYLRAGVFGMAMGTMGRSFIKQIEKQSLGRFSYCFVRNDVQNPPPMYLRFGSDIRPPPSLQTISLVEPFTGYIVKLVDVGVNGERLNINPLINPPGKVVNGLIVDSGAPISFLIKGAYEVLVSKMEKYFSEHKGEFKKENIGNRLCFSRIQGAEGYNNIPSVTYYFQGGAKMDVIPEGTFSRIVSSERRELFCLMIKPNSDWNLLGAFQQVNFKFIFNIMTKTLQFGREDCATKG